VLCPRWSSRIAVGFAMETAGSTFGKPGRVTKTSRSGSWNEHRRCNCTQDAPAGHALAGAIPVTKSENAAATNKIYRIIKTPRSGKTVGSTAGSRLSQSFAYNEGPSVPEISKLAANRVLLRPNLSGR
jgi:hypothetical protein